jgi:hypothetical protein
VNRSGLYVFVAVKKACNLLFEFNGRKRVGERSSARKKLPLDLHGQLVPAYNHRRPQIMQNVRFVLDQGRALFPFCIDTAALPLLPSQGTEQRVVIFRTVRFIARHASPH